jgi:endoglucanase
MRELFLEIAERLMRCPAAPYKESLVAAEVVRICSEHKLRFQSDGFGNILVTHDCPSRNGRFRPVRPLVLAAHMDHPGFLVRRRVGGKCYRARFLGGVADSYFIEGTKLLLMPGRVPARLGRRVGKRRDFEIAAEKEIDAEFAVWDLPDFEIKNEVIRGRVCDDLIGVAAILTVMVQLRRTRAKTHVIGAITRAEEVGFHGALALARSRLLPPDSLVISLETSREMPPVKMGSGVIIRVGDRASIFSSEGTRFLTEVANVLAKSRNKGADFHFQRALMQGGTCEATAYQEEGYESAALCVALGNYHNCGANDRIEAEFVSVSDALGMVRLLMAAAAQTRQFGLLTRRLPARLDRYLREAKTQLNKHPLAHAQ